jgi:hypothetical protein
MRCDDCGGGRDTCALQHNLAHRNIQHPTRSTELVGGWFEGWRGLIETPRAEQ